MDRTIISNPFYCQESFYDFTHEGLKKMGFGSDTSALELGVDDDPV